MFYTYYLSKSSTNSFVNNEGSIYHILGGETESNNRRAIQGHVADKWQQCLFLSLVISFTQLSHERLDQTPGAFLIWYEDQRGKKKERKENSQSVSYVPVSAQCLNIILESLETTRFQPFHYAPTSSYTKDESPGSFSVFCNVSQCVCGKIIAQERGA